MDAALADGAGSGNAHAAAATQPPDEYDARFEFDAPRFYDFGNGSPQGGDAADAWFETSATKGEGGQLRMMATPAAATCSTAAISSTFHRIGIA